MGNKKIKLDKKELKELYLVQKLSPYKIAPIVGCNFGTVKLRLIEYNIPLRSKAQAQMKYPKHNFSKNKIEAAYLLGFRLGDLNVYIPKSKKSETIVARCHTTDKVQVNLMKKLFAPYGQVTISKSVYGYNINCFLNNSFKFLLPKVDKVEKWIEKNNKTAQAFIAAYTDAEGNFIINQGKARFKIDSYDKNILHWIYNWLIKNNVKAKLRIIGTKGQKRSDKTKFNEDLWRLNVNEAHSLEKTINMIKPYLQHKKRIEHVNKMLVNIKKRKEYGTI